MNNVIPFPGCEPKEELTEEDAEFMATTLAAVCKELSMLTDAAEAADIDEFRFRLTRLHEVAESWETE